MNYFLSAIILVAAFSLLPIKITAQTGKSIMEASKNSVQSDDQQVTFTLDLMNAKGKKRSQECVWTSKTDEADLLYSFFRFLAPSDIKGTGFLSIEHPSKEDNLWLFLPALGKSRRISSNEKSDSFMGSDFTYEDLERINLIDFDYELVGEESIDGQQCYKIDCVPNNTKTRKDSGYSKRIFYINQSDYQVPKIEFYNKKNQLSKMFLGKKVKKVAGQDVLRTYYMEMINVKSKHKSILNFSEFKIDSGMNTDFFTVRNLEKI